MKTTQLRISRVKISVRLDDSTLRIQPQTTFKSEIMFFLLGGGGGGGREEGRPVPGVDT